MKTVNKARIPSEQAKEIIPKLMKADLVERSAKISKDGIYRLIPIVEGSEQIIEEMGYEIVRGPAYSIERRSPQERILEALSDLPEDVLNLLPTKWEYVGDIVILKLDSSAQPFKTRIGQTYAEVLDAESVCADIKGVSGEFRRPSMELLFGTKTESVRLENGILYGFDVTKVMFASGNTDERHRMESLDCTGETVVDMFAGIGYFTLPLAKFANPAKVIACEKNPDSHGFLVRNVERNDLIGIVEPMLGDNRDIPGEHFADRILMGYVQTTSEFVPKALTLIKPGGMIHYHDTFYVDEYEDKIKTIFTDACGENGYKIEGIREVKSFAPSVSHYVADIRIL